MYLHTTTRMLLVGRHAFIHSRKYDPREWPLYISFFTFWATLGRDNKVVGRIIDVRAIYLHNGKEESDDQSR